MAPVDLERPVEHESSLIRPLSTDDFSECLGSGTVYSVSAKRRSQKPYRAIRTLHRLRRLCSHCRRSGRRHAAPEPNAPQLEAQLRRRLRGSHPTGALGQRQHRRGAILGPWNCVLPAGLGVPCVQRIPKRQPLPTCSFNTGSGSSAVSLRGIADCLASFRRKPCEPVVLSCRCRPPSNRALRAAEERRCRSCFWPPCHCQAVCDSIR